MTQPPSPSPPNPTTSPVSPSPLLPDPRPRTEGTTTTACVASVTCSLLIATGCLPMGDQVPQERQHREEAGGRGSERPGAGSPAQMDLMRAPATRAMTTRGWAWRAEPPEMARRGVLSGPPRQNRMVATTSPRGWCWDPGHSEASAPQAGALGLPATLSNPQALRRRGKGTGEGGSRGRRMPDFLGSPDGWGGPQRGQPRPRPSLDEGAELGFSSRWDTGWPAACGLRVHAQMGPWGQRVSTRPDRSRRVRTVHVGRQAVAAVELREM